MKVAAQLFTLRDYCGSTEELFDTLKRIRHMGYDGVELESTLIKHTCPEVLGQKIRELGLAVCSVRSPFGRIGIEFENMVKEAKAASSEYTGIGTITGSYCFNNAGPAGYQRFAKEAIAAGTRFQHEGLKTLYSLRSHEFVREADGRWGFENLEEAFSDSTVQFEVDIFHLIRAGLDPNQIIKRITGNVPIVRFRDQRIAVGEVHFFYPSRENCPVGDGLFDFESFLPSMEQAGTKWITLGQEFCTRDPFECMERSLTFTKNILTDF